MPLTPNLSMNRPPHGDYPNTWDQPVNQNWDIIDGLFSASTPPGHKHDGTAGMGPKIDHTDLLSIGTKTHAELDAGFEKAKVSAADTTADYLESKIVQGANITITKLNPGGNEQLEISTAGGGSAWVPEDEYGDKHTVPTSAPVAYTDNFTYPHGFPLDLADYTIQKSAGGSGVAPIFFTTGYSAKVYVDPAKGDDPVGKYAATVSCQIPHGVAQRATCGITDIDYSNMEVGDYVAFTLSVFSTHRLGTALPQKHGVLLEIHLTKISSGPDVFQLSHRIFVLPDSVTQVLIGQHHHTTPDHMKGAWELSLDSNGHIYHYWRRKLAHSTQSVPPTTAGPVQAYISTLMASLLADGDEKYGAMGFGFHYGISPSSKFDFEFRWLTVTSDSDIYDEDPPCPGTADPYGVVTITELPEHFFMTPGIVPGAECCPAPNQVNVGDVLQTDPISGEPVEWVSECGTYLTDLSPTGIQAGFKTNSSPYVMPCVSPALDPDGIKIFDLTGYWPEEGPIEGTVGKIVVHGINYLPYLLNIKTANPWFVIIDVVWLSFNEFEIKYEILSGGGGTDIDLDISNSVSPSRSLTIPVFDTIQAGTPELTSATWIDTYTYSLVAPTGGYRFETVFTGKNLTGATLSTATAGVTIHGFTVDSPTQITADIEIDFSARGAPAVFSVDPSGSSPLDLSVNVDHPVPVGTYIDFGPAPTGPDIGPGKTLSIYGNFFAGLPPLMTIEPVDPLQVGAWTVLSVTQYQIDIEFEIISPSVDPLLQVFIENADSGLNITIPICVIGDLAPLAPLGTPVTTTPTDIYCAGWKPGPGGYPPFTYVVDIPAGGNESCYTLIGGPAPDEVWRSSGGSHTKIRAPFAITGEFTNQCGENMGVDVTVIKPGVNALTIPGAFLMADPTPPVVSGLPIFSVPPEPGAAGTVEFPFSSYNYLTDVENISVAGITLTNWTDTGTGVQYDFLIASTVPPASLVDVSFLNGPCDPGPAAVNSFTTEYLPPVISSVEGVFYEDVANYVCTVKGENFQVGATVIIGGNATYVSHVDVDTETIELTINLGSPGGATIQVTNPDGKSSNVFPITVLAELPADVDHAELEPSTTGVSATLYIYGDNLNPPGAVLAFSGFTPSGPATYHTDSYIQIDGTITAVAGGDVTLDITSTSHSYLGLWLAKATASPGGSVVIHSIDNREPKDNQSGFITTIFGENMDLVFSVEATPTDPDRLALDYQPVGPTPAVTVSIVSKTVNHITLSVNLENGLAYNAFDFLLYDVGVILVATAPSAITAQPSDDAPDISEGDRLVLDGAIPSAASAPWSVAIPVDYVFGDEIIAGSGWVLDAPLPVYAGGSWTVNGINAGAPGENWELIVSRPSVPERAVYRIPGGVTI